LEKINYKKHGITAKKYGGDDSHSWAVFLNNKPKVVGLTKGEVDFYKKEVYSLYILNK